MAGSISLLLFLPVGLQKFLSMKRRNRLQEYFGDLTAILVVALLLFWFAREIIWDGKVPFFRDLNTYFYPLRFALWKAFNAGELPLWNRHFAMGFPVLADFQSGVFYPPHLLFLFLPFFAAIRLVYVFHYLVAGIGGYLLWRHWNYPRYLSIAGALLFALGGTMVSLINLLNHFQAAVWLPWAILFWERFLQRKSWRRFVVLAAVLSIQFLAGSPEIYGMTVILLFLDVTRTQELDIQNGVWRKLGWLTAANFVVVAVAAIQVLPTIELVLQSRRQEGIPYPEAISWSLNPWSLLNLVFLDKSVDMGVGDGTQLFFDRDIPLLVSHYFGVILFFGITFWFHNSSVREKLTFGLVFVVSLVLAFGNFTPIYPLLYKSVPVFRAFRYPEKLFFLTHAILLFVTLKGLLSFQQLSRNRSNQALWISGLGCGLLFLIYLLLRLDPLLLSKFIVWHKGFVLPNSLTLQHVASVLVTLERQLALLGGVFALFLLFEKSCLREPVFKILLVAMIFIDLNWAHERFQYLLKPEAVFSTPNILSAPDTEPNRIFYYPNSKNLHAGAFVILRPPATPFNEVYSIVSSNLLPNAGVQLGFDYMQDINALASESYLQFLKFANQIEPQKQFRLLGALNVKYVVSFHSVNASGITLIRHFPQYPSWLYRIDHVAPRAYIVHYAKEEKNVFNVLEQLSGERLDPATEVLLNEIPRSGIQRGSQSRADIINYGNQEAIIRAFADAPGVLVLADSFYPGWHVYVDGKEEKLLRANYFFRGVGIPAGEHLVEFKYIPFWFYIGRVISILTCMGILGISVYLALMHSVWVGGRRNLYVTRALRPSYHRGTTLSS